MYRRILIPTDGSDEAARGVDYGLTLAEEHGAAVDVLFVVDERVYGETPALGSFELALEEIEEQGHALVDAVGEEAAARDLTATCRCVRGVPHRAILDYADANDVDLVVMGKRGASGVEPPHLGSVTDRVLRLSERPVLPV
ncbi:universal stress protein [Halomarina ordinaria]|uniref:Universal stress protein n=1 Tax=Halomarina ordinaria TaxID=3033939 RepID=A0ABD5UD58_9EURY|nr:universal stress protein [Halomarina sp. PSRA2]